MSTELELLQQEVEFLAKTTEIAVKALQAEIAALTAIVVPPPPPPSVSDEERKAILLDTTQHWNPAAMYQQGESVQHEGMIYVAEQFVNRQQPAPPSDFWLKIA